MISEYFYKDFSGSSRNICTENTETKPSADSGGVQSTEGGGQEAEAAVKPKGSPAWGVGGLSHTRVYSSSSATNFI